MSRKLFIESHGATCNNWTWSWSFVNHKDRLIIFGAWDVNQSGTKALILSEDWQISRRGRKQPAYTQSREHIRLIEDEGYRLMTFPMIYSYAKEEGGIGPATIGGFTPVLTEKSLLRIGANWYASDDQAVLHLPEEVATILPLVEGASKQILVNAYERNRVAREQCLQHHGYSCCVCEFSFEQIYGPLGKGYIHVHHLVPFSEIKAQYVVDPIKDLLPICPNCHAMIHRTVPALSVSQLKAVLVESHGLPQVDPEHQPSS
jgi:5-methylcytosine-specific restriction enzyme A